MGYSSIGPGLDRLTVPLIHLTGLDINVISNHKCVYDSIRSSQNLPMNLIFVPAGHTYPACKLKKEHLDLYLPSGALKIKWVNKQLEVIPSVLCYFIDLEFNGNDWKSKLQDIKSKVDLFRQNLYNRKTTIAVCVLQSEPVEPSNEQLIQIEFTLGVTRTTIFMLPTKPDHLSGYVQRLQTFLVHLSHNYYDAEITEVKMRQEMNASRMHPLLYCRYLFKLAFYCEIRQSIGDALTFYKHCYSRLTSDAIEINKSNLSQVQAFATLVNFKLIKIYLTLPPYYQRDFALKQLYKHIDFWLVNQGPAELGFEFYAWIANQYRVYGDLLAENTSGLRVNGQAAFYYLKSAKYERDRANFIHQIKAQVLNQKFPAVDITLKEAEFLGERTWRPDGGINADINNHNEMIAMFILQYKECHVDHCLQITKTLNKANAEFKNCGYGRFRPHLLIMMVEEYLRTDEDEAKQRALTLIYKCYEILDSSWKDIHIRCHELMYKCATELGDDEKTIIALAHLIGETSLANDQREHYHDNFFRLVNQSKSELMIPNVSQELIISGNFRFSKHAYLFGEDIEVQLDIRNNSLKEITIDKIKASFSISALNEIISIEDSVTIEGNLSKRLSFKISANAELSEKLFVLETIYLYIGNICFEIDRNRLPIDSSDFLPMTSWAAGNAVYTGPAENAKMFKQSCKVLAPQPRATIIILDPDVIHVGEILEITVKYNIEDSVVPSSAKVIIQTNKESLIERSKEDLVMKDPCQHLTFDILDKSGEVKFWLKHSNQEDQEQSCLIVANLQYKTRGPETQKVRIPYINSSRAELKLSVIRPLQISSKCASDLLLPLLATPHLDKLILALIKIESTSNIPITIERIEFSETAYLVPEMKTIEFNNINLVNGDSCQGVFFLKQTGRRDESSASLDLGKIKIFWRRTDNTCLFNHISPLGYLPLSTADRTICAESKLPSVVRLHEAFNLDLYVTNETDKLVSICLQIEESETVKLASETTSEITLIPKKTAHKVTIRLIPMISTWINLPKVTVSYTTGNGVVLAYPIDEDIPKTIFVMPSLKCEHLSRILHPPIKI